MAENLVLIGYRGAGKSTLARKLHKRLKMPLVSTDEELERRFGRPISEWVAAHDWDAFRQEEMKVVEAFSGLSGHIIDCGGGVVERAANVEKLREHGMLFYLCAPAQALARRIHPASGRPSLTGKDPRKEVAEVLARRDPLYRAAAHHVVDVNGRAFYGADRRIAEIWSGKSGLAPENIVSGRAPGRRRRRRNRRPRAQAGGSLHGGVSGKPTGGPHGR